MPVTPCTLQHLTLVLHVASRATPFLLNRGDGNGWINAREAILRAYYALPSIVLRCHALIPQVIASMTHESNPPLHNTVCCISPILLRLIVHAWTNPPGPFEHVAHHNTLQRDHWTQKIQPTARRVASPQHCIWFPPRYSRESMWGNLLLQNQCWAPIAQTILGGTQRPGPIGERERDNHQKKNYNASQLHI